MKTSLLRRRAHMNAKRNMRISFAVSPAQDYTAGMGTLHSDCVFCERILQRRSEAVWDQPLAQTDDYLVVPTKGAIVPGWLMVVSKEHLLCAGALPSDALTGLRRALQITKRLVEPNFGPATLFEHGPTTRGTALGCGVDHLHIHVASLPFSLRTSFRSLYRDSTWTAVTDWTDLSVVHKRGTPYIAIQGPSE